MNLWPRSDYEVHSFNRLRGDVRLRKRCDRSQDSRSQVHPQPWIQRFNQNRVPSFSKERVQIVFCGGDALANPPELVGVESPGEAVISLTSEKFTFELEQVPAAAADLRLVVCASAPQGNGITRAYSKAAVIGGPFAVEAAEIDIKAAYETKNGAPTAAAPKVFMKYFFVNTKTGEKSGEMMAIARL